MCLVVSRNDQIKPAEKDITIYKALCKISDNEWITPFCRMKISNPVKGMSIKAEGDICRVKLLNENKSDGIYTGMLHGYYALSRIKAKYLINNNLTIWKMIIPKGTYYIVGEQWEVAAKEMIFEKVLTDEEITALPYYC